MGAAAHTTVTIVLRYHEIALKGRNRPFFVRRLVENVERATAGLPVGPGRMIQAATGAAVDLDAAALTVAVDILPGRAFFAVEKVPGAGGLPVGTSGRVLALLSGGIDSPVAAWRMMRRGCRVDLVHFHSLPFLD